MTRSYDWSTNAQYCNIVATLPVTWRISQATNDDQQRSGTAVPPALANGHVHSQGYIVYN